MEKNTLQAQASSLSKEPTLCVDLDGTLIYSDVLQESIIKLVLYRPYYLLLLPFWLLRGKAWFKHCIAQRSCIDVSKLPYNHELLTFLREQHRQGREIVLATASNVQYATAIADYLGIFSRVIASNETNNISGTNKLSLLLDHCGEKKFDYIGNAAIDLRIWPHCRQAIIVNATTSVEKLARHSSNVVSSYPKRKSQLVEFLRALRLYQWPKNLLVFINLLMAHQFTDSALLGQTVVAFIAFCLCASSVYLVNDLYDLEADRQHKIKKNRPFAAGTLPLVSGLVMAPLLLLLAITVSIQVSMPFTATLVFYYLLTLAYSFGLKKVAILDVILLAALYTLRVIAGAAIVSAFPSFWLMAFSMSLFVSLAVVKRYVEIMEPESINTGKIERRGYQHDDAEILVSLGISSGYMAILVLALYIHSEDVTTLYTHPELIWLLCPLLMYWISRIWLLARRRQLRQDPVIFAITDRRSYLIALAVLLIIYFAI